MIERARPDRTKRRSGRSDADRDPRAADTKRGVHVVVDAQTAHGCVTVRARPRNETRHIVDYATDRERDRVAGLEEGATVRLELSRIGRRSNVWRAESVAPRCDDTARD